MGNTLAIVLIWLAVCAAFVVPRLVVRARKRRNELEAAWRGEMARRVEAEQRWAELVETVSSWTDQAKQRGGGA